MITPLAALDPYNEVDAASFSTENTLYFIRINVANITNNREAIYYVERIAPSYKRNLPSYSLLAYLTLACLCSG
jgi:hypothetical protein